MRQKDAEEKLAADPLFYMESCLYIRPKAGGIIPFRLNKEQKELYDTWWKAWSTQDPVFIIILKARQLGLSTLVQGLLHWLASTHFHQRTLTLADELDHAANLLSMAELYTIKDQRHVLGYAPMIANVNKDTIIFDNPDWRDRVLQTGLGSSMTIGTAGNRQVGRSGTVQALHFSEAGYFKMPQVMSAVLPSCAKLPHTMRIMESTANGAAGMFYETWRSAVAGENEWTPIFLSWKGRPEYRVRLTPRRKELFEPTPYEEKLMATHGLVVEEIEWRRRTIAGPECQGQDRSPEDVFREIYPLTAEEAFIGSGRSYFDMGAIILGETIAKDMPKKTGVLVPPVDDKEPTMKSNRVPVVFHEDVGAALTIWQHPKDGEDYVIGADVGAGLPNGDFSVAAVMHRQTEAFVARYRARLPPERFAPFLVLLAWYYNGAFLAPEANAIGLYVARYCSRHYRRCAYKVKLNEMSVGEIDPEHPGWWTDPVSRREMMNQLRQHTNDGTAKIFDPVFFAEAKTFVVAARQSGQVDESRPRALVGKKDDCVMAYAIALAVNDVRIAGPIRKPKLVVPAPRNWLEAAMREDQKGEQEGTKPRRVLDEHVGTLWYDGGEWS